MKKSYIIQIMLCIVAALLPAYVSANSIEYSFDDTFFSGTYIPSLYVHSDVHFNQGGNDFGGKMFFQDIKIIPLMQLGLIGNAEKNCYKQLRGFYVNTARGNRVWPLDEDSLAYLQSIDSSYNFMMITGGLFVCDHPSNGLVGYLQHIRKGEKYSLVVGTEYDFPHNDYLPLFASNGSFLFEEEKTHGYVWDSYGGIAYVQGSGLDIQYACGNGIVEDTEECDAGLQNGTIVGVCNESCNGTTLSICGDGSIQSDYETCDSGSGYNGSAGYCNLACTSMIPVVVPPSGGGGGGGGSVLPKDVCPAVRDCSSSYYDSLCGPCVVEPPIGIHPIAVVSGALVLNSPYSQELTQAYQWAYSVGITTVPTIQKANLTGTLLRKYAAKMISQFAVNVLAKQPNDLFVCPFADMANESLEMQYYARLACKLGIMGLQSNGTPDSKFNPNDNVTRAQFGTILSRLLYGDTYNGQPGKRYEAHLQALKLANIMTRISQPMMLELRGRVMVMLQRIGK